ncbi:extracellular solute-binding protein [Paenibacillus agaridevorans]|uniref:extracellular solute-binding protein n=1 Tax=Paenibacillus agaridevorans TaxID=171404 RepID=UPI001BE48FD3|nr:extracellular solute-binding protein [Paenibacillus agaridevorans]
MSRKGLKLVTVATIVSLLAACSANNSSPSPTANPSNPSANTGTGEQNESAAKGLTGELEIAAFVAGDTREQWWNTVIDDFKQDNPDLKVTAILSGVIGDEIRPRWIKNDPPDVTYLGGESSTKDIQQLTSDRKFEKLDEWLKEAKSYEDPDKLLVDVLSVANRAYDPDGDVIGLPFSTGAYGIFYDAKLARDKGWTDLPTNWDDFIAFLDMIEASGEKIAPINYPGQNALGYLTNYMFYDVARQDPNAYLDGVNIVDGAWLNPLYLESFNKLQSLRKYELAGSLGATHTEAQIAFLQRKSFFYPTGTWLEGEMANDVPEDFEMQVIPFPINGKGEKSITQTYASTDLYIPVEAKNKDNAKEFIRYMYQEKYAKLYAELVMENFAMNVDLTGVQTAPSVISYSKMLLDPNLTVFQTNIGRNPTVYVDLNNIFFDELNKAWAGKQTGEQLFANMDKEASKYKSKEGFEPIEDRFLVEPSK